MESPRLALRDVQLDWYRVLGHQPPIITYPLKVNTRADDREHMVVSPTRPTAYWYSDRTRGGDR